MDYKIGIQHSYRGHHCILQNVLILEAIQVTFHTMEHSSPFTGVPAPTVDRHTTTAFEGRHIRSPQGLKTKTGPSFAELNVDSSQNTTVSHLRSTLLSANAKRYSLCSSVRNSFTAAYRALRPASLSLEISSPPPPRKASSGFKIPCTDERVSMSFVY